MEIKVFIEVLQAKVWFALHVFPDIGNAEASLIEFPLLPFFINDVWIDHYLFKVM